MFSYPSGNVNALALAPVLTRTEKILASSQLR
jgi:hypothetical protein